MLGVEVEITEVRGGRVLLSDICDLVVGVEEGASCVDKPSLVVSNSEESPLLFEVGMSVLLGSTVVSVLLVSEEVVSVLLVSIEAVSEVLVVADGELEPRSGSEK